MRVLPSHNYGNPFSMGDNRDSNSRWSPRHSIKKFNIRSIWNLLNVKIRINRRITIIRVWMVIMTLVILTGSIVNNIRSKNVMTYEELMNLPFEKRYSNKVLNKIPMSKRPIESEIDSVFEYGCREPDSSLTPRMNAAFVVLARNSEIDGVISSMKSLERHFNQWYNYPWIFLNNEKFTKEFKKRVAEVSSGGVKFGFIPRDKWDFPDEINNPIEFKESVENQGDREIMYGSMSSYHKMCRFYSGYFFKHPLVSRLEYYWRVEPDVEFYCDLTYDPFYEMSIRGKVYGFTIMIKELLNTVPNLFRYTKAFIKKNEIKLPNSFELFEKNYNFFKSLNDKEKFYLDINNKEDFFKRVETRTPMNRVFKLIKEQGGGDNNNLLDKIDQNSINSLVDHSNKKGILSIKKDRYEGKDYNLCHFWSNFEIARVDLFKSIEYEQFFEYLENSKGFYKERWGDAPIHSLAAGMFLNITQIHYFRDIGYKHSTLSHCPFNNPNNQLPYKKSLKYKNQLSEEEEKFWLNYDKPIDNDKIGVGCRCKCPTDIKEDIENSGGSCISLWSKLTDDDREFEKYLDIDRIEIRSLQIYENYISNKKNDGSEWKLSFDDIKELEKLTIE